MIKKHLDKIKNASYTYPVEHSMTQALNLRGEGFTRLLGPLSILFPA
jgi:hypothetical protein